MYLKKPFELVQLQQICKQYDVIYFKNSYYLNNILKIYLCLRISRQIKMGFISNKRLKILHFKK